ncbi:MAG: serine/threonine-protein phosphatase [Lachnospiraceae bacterium]|nr:serine/threonine-protein phosphatase [Lachnospiraceae bacterium]
MHLRYGILDIMLTGGFYSINSILNTLAALVLMIALFFSAFVKKERGYGSRFFYAALVTNLAGALSVLDISFSDKLAPGYGALLTAVSSIFFFLGIYSCCFFFAMYLACNAGYEEEVKRHLILWMLPFLAAASIVTIVFVSSGTVSSGYTLVLFIISRIMVYLYLAAAFFLLWKIDRTLVVLPVILFIIMIYFNIVLSTVTVSPFIIALCITYVYLSLTKRMILIHLGGIILTLSVMTLLVIGNMITSSAFVSYLKTIHDRNDSHLAEVISYMESYKALPWLMEYWTDNAGIISSDLNDAPDQDFDDAYSGQLAGVSVEKAESFTEDMQLAYAEACYSHIAYFFELEFNMHNLDDLFLIVPLDSSNALIIFDAERNKDGSYRLGEYRDIREESKEWDNYQTVISDTSAWTWGQYTNDDDFGFYREIPFGEDGTAAYLCNSFDRSEIYGHLAFISTSRIRAIRYLSASTVIILLSLYFMLMRPLAIISRTAKRYQKDKDLNAVMSAMDKIYLKNEIGTFADEFSSLAREMDRYTRQEALLAGVSTELRMASDIQQSAIPRSFPAFPERTDFDIYADMKPAKEVGGDFYDFFLTDESHLAFMIADVSDKGIPASLFMMSAKNLISYRAREGGSPGEILTTVNSHLCRNNDSMMFVTVWLGILDLKTGILSFASAGHEPPAIRTGDGPFVLRADDSHGIAMGVMEDAVYPESETGLKPGDVIYIYTDGVTEARNASDELFGTERMLACLDGAKDDTPEGIIHKVNEALEDYARGVRQSDDITMLAVRLSG